MTFFDGTIERVNEIKELPDAEIESMNRSSLKSEEERSKEVVDRFNRIFEAKEQAVI